MKASEWLDLAKEKRGGISDYALAKELGITRAAVSDYRNRGTTLGDDVCISIAEILGIDPMQVIADQHGERAKSEKVRKIWERASRTAAILTLAAIAVLFSGSTTYATAQTLDGLYIMRTAGDAGRGASASAMAHHSRALPIRASSTGSTDNRVARSR